MIGLSQSLHVLRAAQALAAANSEIGTGRRALHDGKCEGAFGAFERVAGLLGEARANAASAGEGIDVQPTTERADEYFRTFISSCVRRP